MKIFAASLVTETNTFCPLPTGLEDFTIERGEVARLTGGTGSGFDLEGWWGKLAQERSCEFSLGLRAYAQPGGITLRTAYEALRDELLDDVRRTMPVDVVLLLLHGAMVAEGYDDCEQDIIRRVRDIVGNDAIVAVEFDLHCHLHESKIAAANIVVLYKEYPHTDIKERACELFELAMEAQLGHIRPRMALFDCRMIGSYPTTREPLRSFIKTLSEAEARPHILSASFGHGFRSADLPHVGAKVLVVADGDQELAIRVARELGIAVYGLRRQIGFESISLPMEAALGRALASSRYPVVVADQSDNVGGGAPGDSTYALSWLLRHEVEDAAVAILYDPGVVKIAKKAGKGARLAVRLGGKLGPSSGDPLDLEVTVHAISTAYVHAWPQQSGEPVLYAAGDVAALRVGGVDIVVSTERCQCLSPTIFTDLGIDPTRRRLLILKSNQHFYSAFAPIAAEVIYMAAPGAAQLDPRLIPYRRLNTEHMYPWVDDPLGLDSRGTSSA